MLDAYVKNSFRLGDIFIRSGTRVAVMDPEDEGDSAKVRFCAGEPKQMIAKIPKKNLLLHVDPGIAKLFFGLNG